MDQGVWLVVGSAVVALVTAVLLRKRLAAVAVGTILVAAGAGIGWGGMLIQNDPSPGELAAAILILAMLVPSHARIVLGPFGPQR